MFSSAILTIKYEFTQFRKIIFKNLNSILYLGIQEGEMKRHYFVKINN